jgi:F0F1-type ATP synthase assembly protein I
MSLLCAVLLLADEPRNTGPEFGKASPFGLLVIVLLLLGTVALVWSMNRQLKKVPRSFDRDDAADPGTADDDPSR